MFCEDLLVTYFKEDIRLTCKKYYTKKIMILKRCDNFTLYNKYFMAKVSFEFRFTQKHKGKYTKRVIISGSTCVINEQLLARHYKTYVYSIVTKSKDLKGLEPYLMSFIRLR